MSLLDSMDAASQDITAEHCQGWIWHTKIFFPICLAREDFRCDVDENMWPNAENQTGTDRDFVLFILQWIFCLYIHIIH